MGKNLRDMTRQEQASYFKSKDYCGEQLKVVMDAIGYGISADYLQLFEDTAIPVETMENMFTAMKEDYGVEETAFLSTVRQEESRHILLGAMKSGVPLAELQKSYRKEMLPIELREKILPLMQGREAIPEKIGEKMEFITEVVRDLKESLLRQNSFIEELKKSMEEKQDTLLAKEKGTEADTDTEMMADSYYLELEEQFRQAREDAEHLLEEREETNRRLRELEAENKNLHEQLLSQKSYAAGLQEQRNRQESGRTGNSQQAKTVSEIRRDRQEEVAVMGMESQKPSNHFPSIRLPFIRKKPGLLEKLAGELDAGQIAEIRLGIEDGLTEGQLAILADKAMDAEKIRELRMTMKILNERGQGT